LYLALLKVGRLCAARKYERDEMIPSIEVAKNIAKILNTTVGCLLGETEQENIFKDPSMLNRFNEIEKLDPENKSHLLSVVDGFIQVLKFKNIAAQKTKAPISGLFS
jgi:transcriptional regulator with XRE-family HTH domain